MSDNAPWPEEIFKEKLLQLGRFYHIHHPFNKKMNAGDLSPAQIQAWVLNRFYYQINIPLKDAAILANCPFREIRRKWIQRVIDHDGSGDDEGGIEAWLALGAACGITRETMLSQEGVLPGVCFAVDAYRNFARQASWQDAVAASLTELFAPEIHQQRLANWPKHYPWVRPEGLQYFRNRLQEVPSDINFALSIVLQHFKTREQQEKALHILTFKLNILWSLLDALYLAYVVDMPPPTIGKNNYV